VSPARKTSSLESPDSEWPAEKQLAFYFHRNGYVRVPDQRRKKKESGSYKMGYETRFVAKSKKEVATMIRLLKQLDFSPGMPYAKVAQWCIPLYGQVALETVQSLANKHRFPMLEKAREQRSRGKASK
jgi:hypothetical protein